MGSPRRARSGSRAGWDRHRSAWWSSRSPGPSAAAGHAAGGLQAGLVFGGPPPLPRIPPDGARAQPDLAGRAQGARPLRRPDGDAGALDFSACDGAAAVKRAPDATNPRFTAVSDGGRDEVRFCPLDSRQMFFLCSRHGQQGPQPSASGWLYPRDAARLAQVGHLHGLRPQGRPAGGTADPQARRVGAFGVCARRHSLHGVRQPGWDGDDGATM